MNKLSEKIQKLVGTGLLTALVIVIYLLTMGLTIGPFNITFALIPIVVGAALYGWSAGTWLGLVFGAMVLFTGGGNAFLVINAPGTIATVLVKGAAAGAVSGLVYKALEKKNRWAATICAAAAAPIVNTGIFRKSNACCFSSLSAACCSLWELSTNGLPAQALRMPGYT